MASRITLVLALLVASASAFVPTNDFRSGFAGQKQVSHQSRVGRGIVGPVMGGKEAALRTRISSVSNTRKITEAMRLVAAAKVRRAQQGMHALRFHRACGRGLCSTCVSCPHFSSSLFAVGEVEMAFP